MAQINVLEVINESVDSALTKAEMENTPKKRISILSGMHRRISAGGNVAPDDRIVLQALEDEIIRLQEEEL
jgi:hypothetical protein